MRTVSGMSKCVVCKKKAVTTYEGLDSCGEPRCEFEMQIGLDYIEENA